MLEKGAQLRIKDGGFTYLLPESYVVSMLPENHEMDTSGDNDSLSLGSVSFEGESLHVIRLSRIFEHTAPDWKQIVVVKADLAKWAIAGESISRLSVQDSPRLQPFMPTGYRPEIGTLIAGISYDRQNQEFALDIRQLSRCVEALN